MVGTVYMRAPGSRRTTAPYFAIQSVSRYDAGVTVHPESLGSHAAENLRFIRSAMERSSTFTSIPGVGGAVMGLIALAASAVAAMQPTANRWLITWLIAAAVASVVGFIAMARKARRAGLSLTGTSARRFALGMAAPFVAGAAITYALWAAGNFTVMAPTWLLLYGTGVLTGGIFSVPVVRAVGLCFMATGIAAIVTPASWGNAWLAIGFGGLQVAFGIYIARNHGG
jgi:hypothetical protein